VAFTWLLVRPALSNVHNIAAVISSDCEAFHWFPALASIVRCVCELNMQQICNLWFVVVVVWCHIIGLAKTTVNGFLVGSSVSRSCGPSSCGLATRSAGLGKLCGSETSKDSGAAVVGGLWDKTSKSTKSSCIERNNQIVVYGDKGDWQAILLLFREQGKDFNDINFATAISRLARIRSLPTGDPLFREFVKGLAARGPEPATDPRSFANVVHALAKLNIRNNESVDRVFQKLSDPTAASQFVKKAATQGIANTAWACAKLDYSCPTLFAALEGQWDRFVADAKPQATATTAWACAELRHSCPKLFAALESQWERFVGRANAQDIAMTARACAKLGNRCCKLFAALESQWERFVSDADPQAIANTAWACAKLDHTCPALFAAMENQWERFVADADPQAIANMAWACAELGHSCPKFFATLEIHAKEFVAKRDPQSIANTALACAKLGHLSPALFAAIESKSKSFVVQATPQGIANTATACAELGHLCPDLFAAIESETKRFLAEAKSHEIAELARACEKLGHELSPEFPSAIQK
jgi:hypothetical protein